MTVQELFKSLDREDFIKYYCQYEDVLAGKYEVTEKGKKIVTDLFNQLLTIDPVPAKKNKNWKCRIKWTSNFSPNGRRMQQCF